MDLSRKIDFGFIAVAFIFLFSLLGAVYSISIRNSLNDLMKKQYLTVTDDKGQNHMVELKDKGVLMRGK